MRRLRELHELRAHVAVDSIPGADPGGQQPLERVRLFRAVEVGARLEIRESLLHDAQHLGGLDVVSSQLGRGVNRVEFDRLASGIVLEVSTDHSGPERDEDHHVHDVDVFLRPRDQIRHRRERVLVHRGVERAGQPSCFRDHLGVLEPKIAVLHLGLVLPLRAVLLAVYVKRQPPQAGLLQFPEQVRGEGQAVRVQDRLDSTQLDVRNDVSDLRVAQRVASGNRDPVRRSKAREHIQFIVDLLERLVALRLVFPVAAEAGEVARRRRFEPGNRVVRQAPRQPIELPMVELGLHTSPQGSGPACCRGESRDGTRRALKIFSIRPLDAGGPPSIDRTARNIVRGWCGARHLSVLSSAARRATCLQSNSQFRRGIR